MPILWRPFEEAVGEFRDGREMLFWVIRPSGQPETYLAAWEEYHGSAVGETPEPLDEAGWRTSSEAWHPLDELGTATHFSEINSPEEIENVQPVSTSQGSSRD
ncbi:hypothetical protein [Alteriqipengyuania sp.]|uniref:hypothetical protein n=1 Tax=Alteriqipengyuania sp. TaxID=2800692 RepID=UPI0035164F7C